MSLAPLGSLRLRQAQDVAQARQTAREVASALGFDVMEQTRIATAVSEISRNAFRYAREGEVRFEVDLAGEASGALVISVRDVGPGIPHLAEVLEGSYRSATGMGRGLLGSKRLMDQLDVSTRPGGPTVVTMSRALPRGTRPTPEQLARARSATVQRTAQASAEELHVQNQELLRLLNELTDRRAESERLSHELMETNRGMVALYAELEEKAAALRAASEHKTRFLSNMSHEFRTPLSSVLGLSQMLLQRLDGPLTSEQEKQVTFILKAAQTLTELVNDLLDLAKIEAGKVDVRPSRFSVEELFASLRGMLRPLQTSAQVSLVFEPPPADLAFLETDEGKLGQILRNLISNALKYTERGEVRVRVRRGEGAQAAFEVQDSGIGISAADQERIFEEFVQVQGPHQRKVRGTGLGLPLSRKLAELLGGSLVVHSEPGRGSTFTCSVLGAPAPEKEAEAPPAAGGSETPAVAAHPVRRILVVDDDPSARYVLRKLLADTPYEVAEAEGGLEGVDLAQKLLPDIIFLDFTMPDLNGLEVLDALGSQPRTARIPVILHTSKQLSEEERRRAQSRVCAILSKAHGVEESDRNLIAAAIARAEASAPAP